jgi:GDP-L-fucose synthase
LYGEDYHLDGRQMHFIFDLIRKILRGKFYEEKVVLWGDGFQKRELVYVHDFVDIMIKLSNFENNTLINIGSGTEHTIRDFANRISSQVSFDENKIIFDETKYVGAKSKVLDVKKLKRILPNIKMVSLDDGLKNTINWFLKNQKNLL